MKQLKFIKIEALTKFDSDELNLLIITESGIKF